MAFYKDTIKRKKTRAERLNEGGWEDEGKHYRNKASYVNGFRHDAPKQETQQPYGRVGSRVKEPNQGGYDRTSRDGRGPQTRLAQSGRNQPVPTAQENAGIDSRPVRNGRDANVRTAGHDGKARFNPSAKPERAGFARPVRPLERSGWNRPGQAKGNICPVSPQPEKTEMRVNPPERFSTQTFSPAAAMNVQNANAPSQPMDNLLSGRNPIREAIKSGRDIEKMLVARGDLSGSAREIISMAKEAHIIVQEVDRSRLDAISPHHQGMLAFASAYQYSTLESIFEEAENKNEKPFIVILDGITDPHNLGAIIRTASCVGAHGIVIPERRAVGLTPSAVRAAAGSIEYIKVAKVTNITRLIEQLKERGIWIFSADQEGTDYRMVDFSGPCALVIGSEGEGISRLVLDHSDYRVSLPMRGSMDSLNASVAAGVLMYSIMAKR